MKLVKKIRVLDAVQPSEWEVLESLFFFLSNVNSGLKHKNTGNWKSWGAMNLFHLTAGKNTCPALSYAFEQ